MPDTISRLRQPWDLGTWLWLLNRIAGVICIVFLLMHICVISTSRFGQPAFDAIMDAMHSPLALFGEFVLIITVAAHGLNGLRHIAIDFGLCPPEMHAKLFKLAAIACAVLCCVGAVWMLA